jgi:hypothetical protein
MVSRTAEDYATGDVAQGMPSFGDVCTKMINENVVMVGPNPI